MLQSTNPGKLCNKKSLDLYGRDIKMDFMGGMHTVLDGNRNDQAGAKGD